MWSEESKLRASERLKVKWNNPTYRAEMVRKHKAFSPTIETIRKRVDSLKKRWVWRKANGLTKSPLRRIPRSESVRKKLSDAHRGKVFPPEHCKNIGLSKKGISHTKEHNNKISWGNFGKHMSEEAKIKISLGNRGKKRCEKDQLLQSIRQRGRLVSLETRIKHSCALKGIKRSELTKQKMSLAKKGGIMAEETRLKIKERSKKYFSLDSNRQKTSEFTKLGMAKLKANPDKYSAFIRNVLHGLNVKPTSYETRIIFLCNRYSLPFKYVGDGTYLVGHKNPDFIDENNKLIIEVFAKFHKIKQYSSVENYKRLRYDYFQEYGWNTVFIDEDSLFGDNWEEKCINLISNVKPLEPIDFATDEQKSVDDNVSK